MLVGARYYDAQVGRFISRDTYLDQNPYLYCDHDPVNAVDPSGHELTPWQKFWAIVRILIMWHTEPKPPVIQNPPQKPPIVRVIRDGGGPEPPGNGGRGTGSGGAAGGIITIGIGVGVGADAAHKALVWRRSIESYLDSDGEWSESGGF